MDYQDNLLENDIFVIPVRLEDCKIPDQLSEYHGVDIFEKDGLQFLINSIKSIEITQTLEKRNSISIGEEFSINFTRNYSTRDISIRVALNIVALNIVAFFRINQISEIGFLINNKYDLKQILTDFIHFELEKYFYRILPERYYLRFSFSPIEGENTVENEIKNLIINKISNKFGIEVTGLNVAPVETDIQQKYHNLSSSRSKFKIDISPLSGGEVVTFEGAFIVDSLIENGWQRFISTKIDLPQLSQYVVDNSSALMSLIPHQELTSNSIQQIHSLIKNLEDGLNKNISSLYGIHLKLLYLTRFKTFSEHKYSQSIIEKEKLKLKMISLLTG